jgi:hypothetical protein
MPLVTKGRFAISCDTESSMLISSKLEIEAWDSILSLVEILRRDKYPSVKDSLFAWRYQQSYLSNAKQTYEWRGIIDSIKEANLSALASELQREGRMNPSELVKSRPIMLRVAGEITNALIHSYTNQHRISFFQCDFTEPS